MPTPDDLAKMYDRSYFETGGDWVCGFWSGSYADNSVNLRNEAIDVLADIQTLRIPGWKLLEIGCAGGYFLDEARRQGYDVAGLELNPDMAAFAREQLHLPVVAGSIEDAEIVAGTYNLIVMQDVLEHIVDPVAAILRVARWLAPGGTLYVRGPLESETRVAMYRAARKWLRRGDRVVAAPPFHVQGFTQYSFGHLMQRVRLTGYAFQPGIHPPQGRGTVATIERIAYLIDRVWGRGNFMRAAATRSFLTTTE